MSTVYRRLADELITAKPALPTVAPRFRSE
jgi:hypothetical protein